MKQPNNIKTTSMHNHNIKQQQQKNNNIGFILIKIA